MVAAPTGSRYVERNDSDDSRGLQDEEQKAAFDSALISTPFYPDNATVVAVGQRVEESGLCTHCDLRLVSDARVSLNAMLDINVAQSTPGISRN